MAKIERVEFATMIAVTDAKGRERENDWRKEYMKQGLMLVFSSENSAPGKPFIHFYPYEPENEVQRRLTSTVGDVTVDTRELFVLQTRNSMYSFEKNEDIPEDDKKMMLSGIIGVFV